MGGTGNDTIDGGAGSDSLVGHSNNDLIQGGTGKDTLVGDTGDDTLEGGDNDDLLKGGAGADNLSGGTGNDTLTGGDGEDRFLLRSGGGVDTIVDYADDIDKFLLDGLVFEDLAFVDDGSNTQIQIAATTEILAIAEDVELSIFNASDFEVL